jgi:cytidylate kinase
MTEDLLSKKGPVIAVDGPAGTGKSSVTRRLAEVLGFVHIDTGALYRAIALLSLRKKDSAPVEIAKSTYLEFQRFPQKNPANRIFANGEDLTDFIRTPEVTLAASRVSAIPEVRAALLGLQRALGCVGFSILEGRDIGTVIFPDADLKFFLLASLEERAKRRWVELEALGGDSLTLDEVKVQIIERDQADSTRTIAPLKKATDALEIDTSLMTLEEVVKTMELIVKNRIR